MVNNNQVLCVQSVLMYAVKLNKQRRVSAATIHYLDAWRQVAEVMFSVAPSETLPFDLRFPLLLGLIHELLSKVNFSEIHKIGCTFHIQIYML